VDRTDHGIGLTYDARLNGESDRGLPRHDADHLGEGARRRKWIIRDRDQHPHLQRRSSTRRPPGDSTLHFVRLQACMRLKTGTSPSIVYLDVAVGRRVHHVLLHGTPKVGPLTPGDYRLDITTTRTAHRCHEITSYQRSGVNAEADQGRPIGALILAEL